MEDDRVLAYRRIHGLEGGMRSGGHESCCARFVRWCCQCFSADEDEDAAQPRSRALQDRDDARRRYEAPPISSGSGALVQQQRATQAYTDDADAGPLLPKTAESSAPLPRIAHSRNNSSASASAGPAGAAAGVVGGAGGESTPKRRSAQDGQLGAGGAEAGAPSHRRSASHGDGKQRRTHKGHDNSAAVETLSPLAAAAVAAPVAAAGAAAIASGVGTAAPSIAPSTAAGRPGAAFGPVQDEEDDFCPTCLEAYSVENPKIFTACGHHFHMPCIYAWLERKDTCPMCESPMDAAGI